MSVLIIMSRPGIMVVGGVIVGVDTSKGEVTIENNMYMPVSKRVDRKKLRFSINRNKISSMKLDTKIGSFILATIKPVPGLSVFLDGGEDASPEYYAEAYNMRFSGSFDFNQIGDVGESHVFCAPIRDKEFIKVRDRIFALLDIEWKRSGALEQRKLVYETQTQNIEPVRGMRKGIFVTGPRRESSYGPVYKIRRMFN